MKIFKVFLVVALIVSAAAAAFASKKMMVTGYLYRPTESIKCQSVPADHCTGGQQQCKIGFEVVKSINDPNTACGVELSRP